MKMAYILSKQRDHDEFEKRKKAWDRYDKYLKRNQDCFPPNAFALAISEWYYNFNDHRCPHDGALEELSFHEFDAPHKKHRRCVSLSITLLSGFGDKQLIFHYPVVYAYSLSKPSSVGGHVDWRYDEFRLTRAGHLLHEIEWCGISDKDARWIIEASDVEVIVKDLK